MTISQNCRTCYWAQTYDIALNNLPQFNHGKVAHRLIDLEMFCPLCQKTTETLQHNTPSFYEWLYTLQCVNCNNYILYIKDNSIIQRDELYLAEDYIVVRFPSNESWIFKKDKHIVDVPFILECKGKDAFTSKIKSLILYS